MANGVFDTSASEIAGYKGQASGGMDAGAAIISGETQSDQISAAMRLIAINRMQKNKDAYDQKLKDQKDLFDQLSTDDVVLKTTLPPDRDFLWNEFRDPIRKMVMDPAVVTDYKKAAALKQKINDFKEAKAYAAVRLKEISKMDSDISAERDPDRRQRMVDHRNKMYDQSIYDQVKPFQEAIDFSKNTLVNPGLIETDMGSEIVGNSEVSKKKYVTPLKGFTEGVYWNYMQNPDHKIKSEMDKMAESVNEMPADQKLWLVKSWNEKIRKANEDNGLKQGDNDYVPEVRYDVLNEKGEPVNDGDNNPANVVLHATTPEIVRAQSIHDNYYNEVRTTSKLSDLAAKIGLQNAQQQKELMEAWLAKQKGKVIPSEIAKNLSEARKHDADARKSFEETKKIKLETDPADWNITATRTIFDPKNYQDLPDANSVTFGGNKLPIKGKVLQNSSVFGAPSGKLADDQLMYLSEQFVIGGKSTLIKPDAVVYNYENTKDPYFTTVYKIPHTTENTKTGVKTTTWDYQTRTIRPNTFMERLAKSTSPGKAAEELNKTMKRYKEMTGKENINGSIFSTFDDPKWKTKNTDDDNKRINDAFK